MKSFLEPLDDVPCFTKASLRLVFGGSEDALNERIKRALRKDELISLRNGLYTTRIYYLTEPDKSAFLEFVASRLTPLSYISSTYILSQYQLLTEATYPLTSVTLQNTRSFQNTLGNFLYQSIRQDLFTGFVSKRYRQNMYWVAQKAKALFDFLYLKRNLGRDLAWELQDGLRINWENFGEEDRRLFQGWSVLARSPKMQRIARMVQKIAE